MAPSKKATPTVKFAYRYRYQLAPIATIAAVLFLGAVAHESPKDGWLWIVCTATIVATVFLFTRRWLDRDIERTYAATGITVAAAWMLAAWKWGVTEQLALVWIIVGLIGAIPWWAHFRIRRPSMPAPKTRGNDAAQVWEEYVAQPGQALPGSRLTHVKKIKHGWAATIILPRGEKSTDSAIAATERITSAYEMPIGSISIEATASGIASQARMTVLEENPLHKPQLFTHPSLDPKTGLAQVGVYGDGDPATFRFWMPKSGPVHSLVSGTTGSGKSRFLDQILAEARHSGRIVTWMIDPQGGQSLPRWVDNVDWAALSSMDGVAMLKAAHQVMHARSRHLARMEYEDERGRTVRGIDYFDPTPEFPLLMLVLEEAHDILRPPVGPVLDEDNPVKLVEDIGKMGRKCGVFVVLATQMPSVKELGDSSALRSMVSSGNVVVFRTSDKLTSGMAFSGSLPVDPSKITRSLPDGSSSGGMGYIVGPGSRTAMMRAFFVEDPYEWATTGTPARLDELSVKAAGNYYLSRRNDLHPMLAIEAGPAPVVDDEPAYEVGPVGEDLEVWDGEVVEPEPEPIPEPVQAPPANAAEAVYAAMVELGTAKTMDLHDATSYSPRTIANAVKKLVAEGRVVKIGHGHYRVAEKEAAS